MAIELQAKTGTTSRGDRHTGTRALRPERGTVEIGLNAAILSVRKSEPHVLVVKADSDDDGIPDAIEWQIGSQPSSKDLGQDPDNDGLKTGDEVMDHMDPRVVDDAKLTAQAYRYTVQRNGEVDDAGRQCFTFRVDNIALAATLPDIRDAGNPDGGAPLFRRGAGFNDLMVITSMVPGDTANGRTLIRSYRHKASRYPVGGIKLPSDGVIRVKESDFVAGCGNKAGSP